MLACLPVLAWQTNVFANRIPVLSEEGIHGVPNLGYSPGSCRMNMVTFVRRPCMFLPQRSVRFCAVYPALHGASLDVLLTRA